MTTIQLLGQAQALQHDPSNNSTNSHRTQKLKGAGNGSRHHSSEPKPIPSSDLIDPRRIEFFSLKGRTKIADSTADAAKTLPGASKRYQSYEKPDRLVVLPEQFVLPEKVLSGVVLMIPRIRPSATSIHFDSVLSMSESFQAKLVLIGSLDVMPSVTSLKKGVKIASALPQQAVVTTTQSHAYAMSVTPKIDLLFEIQNLPE